MLRHGSLFGSETAAARYARGRPAFHPQVIDRLRAFLAIGTPLAHVVDVGCGTGMSTRALVPVARRIVGVDVAPAMLTLAASERTAAAHIDYIAGAAEALPLITGGYDLVTVSSAFHWLQREAFLAEARRVLIGGGWLVVYDNFFSGEMDSAQDFHGWFRGDYLVRFPTPPRSRTAFGPGDAARAGFRFAHQEQYEHRVAFTPERLVDYLVTQTNVIAAVEGAGEPLVEVRHWLLERVRPYFGHQLEAAFRFFGPIWYLQHS